MAFDVDAALAKAREVFDDTTPVDQEILLGDEVVTVRVRPLDGAAWRDLLATFPPRDGSDTDKARGYNLTGVTRAYPRVVLLDGEDEQDVSEKWHDITGAVSGGDLHLIEIAVWGVNEYYPRQRLGKALKGES